MSPVAPDSALDKLALLALLLALGVPASGCRRAPDRVPDSDLSARAERLAQEILILDTHVDLPGRLHEKMEDVSTRTEGGDFDYPRARAGGLKAAFMAIFVASAAQKPGEAVQQADALIDMMERVAAHSSAKFSIARSPAEIRRNLERGRFSLALGLENGVALEGDLRNLDHFCRRGVRYITLAHSENNDLADSSFAPGPKWHGLSPFGRRAVLEMNRLGLMVDVSHLSDEAFYQVMDLSAAPAIASHSSCRAFTPGFRRNMDDGMIRRLAANGGVIQINFGSMFLRDDARRQSIEAYERFREYCAAHELGFMDADARQYRKDYWRQHPRIYGDLADVVAHIDHVARLVGVEHVGLGSDFEGVGDGLPAGLKDVSGYSGLVRELLSKGHSEQDVRKICGENLLRVWSQVETLARPE